MRSNSNRSKGETGKVQISIPRLRFPEFSEVGEWQEKKLEECLDYQQPTAYLVSHTNYDDSYETPVLTAGKTFVLGYTNDKDGIYADDLPVIIFDDFTTATQFVDFPFKAKSSAMKILSAKSGSNIKFMYEVMQLISYDVGVHERHWISRFAPLEILAPGDNEQNKIADCLSCIDACIVAETCKLDALKAHKQSLTKQLFPAEGQCLPRLRFPGFHGAWGEASLASRIHTVTPPRKLQTAEYMARGSYPVIDQSQAPIAGWTDDAAFLIEGPFPLIVFGDHTCTLKLASSPFAQGADGIKIFHAKEGVSTGFLYQFLLARPVAIQDYRRHFSILKEKPVFFPAELKEQACIFDFLSGFDIIVVAQSRKIETLKQHKKGLMKDLFPAMETPAP